MVPRYDPIEQAEQNASYEEPRTRRRKKQEPSRAGSHLAQGTLARTRGTEVQEDEVSQPRVPRIDTRQKEPKSIPELERDDVVDYAEPAVKTMSSRTEREERRVQLQRQAEELPLSPSNYLPEVDTRSQQIASPRPVLSKKPSVVHEESEPESEKAPQVHPESQSIFQALDALPVKQHIYEPPVAGREGATQPSAAVGVATSSPVELPTEKDTPVALAQTSDRSGESSRVSSSEQKQTSPPPDSRHPQVARVTRTHSNSPVRTAHFGPILDNNLGIKHSPPPRSISPRKSALKQTSPSRGASPSTDTSEASSAVGRAGRSNTRKKSVRVSFNEDSVVLGEAASTSPDRTASPVSSSPQAAKKPWYSNIGRSKKKDMLSLDDDEVMKPRPALPSFGSIRGKKETKEPEERPLVRPMETTYSPSIGTSPAVTPSEVDEHQVSPPVLESSSDVALGSLLMQEQQRNAERNAANISRFREPLPPVVTSIESHEYVSDSSSSSESEADLIADTPQLTQEESALTSQATTSAESEPLQSQNGTSKPAAPATLSIDDYIAAEPTSTLQKIPEADHEVPVISVTHPSQERLPEPAPTPKQHLDVPGTFPDDESDSASTRGSRTDEGSSAPVMAEVPAQAREATFEPVSQSQDAAHTSHTPATVLATQPTVIDDESETGSSIYSDAYEDLSDVDGDGFLSLNAVVESPMTTSVTKSPFTSSTTSPHQPTPESRSAASKQSMPTVQEQTEGTQQPGNDWEIAKSYWRSLTAEKRAQLEREAMEDAGIDADLEEPVQDKKPRRKKSVEKKQAEKKAIQQAYAQSDRTYMIKPGTRVASDAYTPPMQKTLRGQQAPAPRQQQQQRQADKAPRLRKSMRTNGAPQTQAPQQPPPRPTINKTARRQSFPLPEREEMRGHGRTMSDSGPPQPPAMNSFFPPLRRRGSDSSESSFRRARPASSGGGFGFRKTMRHETPPMPASPDGSKDRSHRFSLRSLSPGGSPFRRTSVASPPPVSMGSGMRMSMRDQKKPEKSSGILSFGSKKASGGGKKKAKSSRFDDSSDDDDVPRGFRSRFEDSSDEDATPSQVARPLALPKTMRQQAAHKSPPLPEEEEESADLRSEDENSSSSARYSAPVPASRPAPVTTSSFERNAASSNIGTGTLRRERSGRGTFAPASPSSPPANTRRASGGLFSGLRRKKGPGAESKIIGRGEVMDSAARRDTKLERSARELEAMRGAPGHRTLQKRTASVPTGIGRVEAPPAWPLSGRVDEGDEVEEAPGYRSMGEDIRRPATSSGGKEGLSKPALPRRSLSHGVLGIEEVGQGAAAAEEASVLGGEKKKKKKFGALRRMFRLDD